MASMAEAHQGLPLPSSKNRRPHLRMADSLRALLKARTTSWQRQSVLLCSSRVRWEVKGRRARRREWTRRSKIQRATNSSQPPKMGWTSCRHRRQALELDTARLLPPRHRMRHLSLLSALHRPALAEPLQRWLPLSKLLVSGDQGPRSTEPHQLGL